MSNNITQLGETQYVFYILPKRLLQLCQPSYIEMLDNFAQQINVCPVDRIAVFVATYWIVLGVYGLYSWTVPT